MRIKHGVALWLALGFAAVLVVTIFLAFAVSEYYKETTLQRTNFLLTSTIKQAAFHNLSVGDFNPNNLSKSKDRFTEFANEIDGPEIVRLKVWGTNHEIVYSDKPELIGSTYLNDKQLNSALAGQSVSTISYLDGPEDASEKQYGELFKIYVPIKSSSNDVVGVAEVYLSMDLINVYIDNTDKMIFLISSIGAAIFGGMMFLTYSALRRNVINPIESIHGNAKRIAEGDFDIKSKPRGYTELKILESEVETMAKKLKDQQQQLLKTERIIAIGELAARLAHDLRNPLNIILNSLHIIKHKYDVKPELGASFERIDRAVFRMSHQIESVMDFVKVKALQLKPVSLNEILQSAVEKSFIPETIKVSLPTEDVRMVCDPNSMEVVFENLLVNAKQAIRENPGMITVRTSTEGRFLQIEIEDNGPGIAENVLPNIFDPLFTTKQEGTGLGLASCKNIIEQHGGSLEVKTKVGTGTTFIIKLPLISFETQSVATGRIAQTQLNAKLSLNGRP